MALLVNTALQNLENHKVLLKDHGKALLGAALVSLESLDMIFDG